MARKNKAEEVSESIVINQQLEEIKDNEKQYLSHSQGSKHHSKKEKKHKDKEHKKKKHKHSQKEDGHKHGKKHKKHHKKHHRHESPDPEEVKESPYKRKKMEEPKGKVTPINERTSSSSSGGPAEADNNSLS
jgi:hypothetical protein